MSIFNVCKLLSILIILIIKNYKIFFSSSPSVLMQRDQRECEKYEKCLVEIDYLLENCKKKTLLVEYSTPYNCPNLTSVTLQLLFSFTNVWHRKYCLEVKFSKLDFYDFFDRIQEIDYQRLVSVCVRQYVCVYLCVCACVHQYMCVCYQHY